MDTDQELIAFVRRDFWRSKEYARGSAFQAACLHLYRGRAGAYHAFCAKGWDGAKLAWWQCTEIPKKWRAENRYPSMVFFRPGACPCDTVLTAFGGCDAEAHRNLTFGFPPTSRPSRTKSPPCARSPSGGAGRWSSSTALPVSAVPRAAMGVLVSTRCSRMRRGASSTSSWPGRSTAWTARSSICWARSRRWRPAASTCTSTSNRSTRPHRQAS
jgi:hypothetical protein